MTVSYANRGEAFETLIIRSNITYDVKGWAQVEKTDPAIRITQERGNKIIGYKKAKGFVDFFGISNGRALAFEAKTTKNRTSFPLQNIKAHQMETLKKWRDQGAHSFFLIQFEKHFEVYLLTIDQASQWWTHSLAGGRKSIPYEWFRVNCDIVKPKRGVLLDYLGCLQLP
ncbi:Holliday junction resolvase RecU [Priestia aryabhattai]|uniref:Holliday junction resolvase RecU n=1 Tax=Priestia aryabhattai TaxID=412384 RepID=UPI001C8D3570|nr:Holliday junction resolvase RecU [Priestia aryabhattai]MBY0077928.1 Holliday junction resolvase RecU [Priestia aryabhattai]